MTFRFLSVQIGKSELSRGICRRASYPEGR